MNRGRRHKCHIMWYGNGDSGHIFSKRRPGTDGRILTNTGATIFHPDSTLDLDVEASGELGWDTGQSISDGWNYVYYVPSAADPKVATMVASSNAPDTGPHSSHTCWRYACPFNVVSSIVQGFLVDPDGTFKNMAMAGGYMRVYDDTTAYTDYAWRNAGSTDSYMPDVSVTEQLYSNYIQVSVSTNESNVMIYANSQGTPADWSTRGSDWPTLSGYAHGMQLATARAYSAHYKHVWLPYLDGNLYIYGYYGTTAMLRHHGYVLGFKDADITSG